MYLSQELMYLFKQGMYYIFCIFSFHLLSLLGEAVKLFQKAHLDWVPTFHLENENCIIN